jgi:hypothetical protein
MWNLRVLSPRRGVLLGGILVTLIFIHLLRILLGGLSLFKASPLSEVSTGVGGVVLEVPLERASSLVLLFFISSIMASIWLMRLLKSALVTGPSSSPIIS